MSISNGYCTLAEFKSYRKIASVDASDDSAIEDIITDASRLIDRLTGTWFYAQTSTTRYYTVGKDTCKEVLKLDVPFVAFSSITNGDGTTITSSQYALTAKPYWTITLRADSSAWWTYVTAPENAITVTGTAGYVDRTATDPESLTHIGATRRACLQLAAQMYQERNGDGLNGQVTVTQAGVVVTPYGAIPRSVYDVLRPYIRVL